MATVNIPQIDKLIRDSGEEFRKRAKEASKAVEEAIKGLRKLESEEKSMLYNVSVKHEENKVLERYYVMVAMRNNKIAEYDHETRSTKDLGEGSRIMDKKEMGSEPTNDDIAQFLSDSGADFVTVEQNYRFQPDLPFN